MDINHTHLFPGADRFFVGYDRLVEQLGELAAAATKATKYPPYNVVKESDDKYVIELAVAGFGKQDIEVTLKGDVLEVKGNIEASKSVLPSYLHQGIAARSFLRQWTIADHIEITNASLLNGMLRIWLERNVPSNEARTIEVNDESEIVL